MTRYGVRGRGRSRDGTYRIVYNFVIRMVQGIGCIDVEVKGDPLGNRDLLDHGKIHILNSGCPKIAKRNRSGARGVLIDKYFTAWRGDSGIAQASGFHFM